MINRPDAIDQLIRRYLNAVEHAFAGQPEDRRRELLSDLNNHIAAERAALDPPTEAAVRAILDRLGDPTALAAEARLLEDNPTTPSAATAPAGRSGMRRLGPLGWILVALGLTLLTCFILGLVGLVAFSTGGDSTEPTPASTVAPLQPTHQ